MEASGVPSRDTSVRIANALAQAKGADSGPSISTINSSSSTLINPSQTVGSSSSSQRPPNSRDQKQNKLNPPDPLEQELAARGNRGLSPVEALGESQRARSPYFIQLRHANGSSYQSINALLEQSNVAATSQSVDELSNIESRDYETEEQEFAELQATAAARAAKKQR